MRNLPRYLPVRRMIILIGASFLLAGCQSHADARIDDSLTASWDRHNIAPQVETEGILFTGSLTLHDATGRKLEVAVYGVSMRDPQLCLGIFKLNTVGATDETQQFEIFVPKSTIDNLNLTRQWQIDVEVKDPSRPDDFIGFNYYGFSAFDGYEIGKELRAYPQ
jgi:hypothetical protein